MDPFVYMLDREAVGLVINQLFFSLDNKEWITLKECFAKEVVFDISSLVGGEQHRLNADQIAHLWSNSLKEVDALQHQISNMTIFVQNERATSHFYCNEMHHSKSGAKGGTLTLVGTYDIHLVKENSVWKISLFRYHHKFLRV